MKKIHDKIYIFISILIAYSFFFNTAQAKTNFDRLHYDHQIIAKYECGNRGYSAIGKDNYGGYSYGKWQISTERRNNRPSTFDFYLKYTQKRAPYIYKALMKAGGTEAAYNGTTKFINTWKNLSAQAEFRQIYNDFLLTTQVFVLYKKLDSVQNSNFDKITDWGSNNNAIQATLQSLVIQHGAGGAYKIIETVLNSNENNTKQEFLLNIFKERMKRFPKYKKRYEAECKDLVEFLNSSDSKLIILAAD